MATNGNAPKQNAPKQKAPVRSGAPSVWLRRLRSMTPRDWLRLLQKLLPHAAIVISGMLIVFFVIDRVNKPMGFMTNEFHKRLTFVLSLIAIYMAVMTVAGQRRAERAAYKKRAREAQARQTARPQSQTPRPQAQPRPQGQAPRASRPSGPVR